MATRDEQVERLVENDIKIIRSGLEINDTTYLEAILKGEGWTQYSKMTSEEVASEYGETFGSVPAIAIGQRKFYRHWPSVK